MRKTFNYITILNIIIINSTYRLNASILKLLPPPSRASFIETHVRCELRSDCQPLMDPTLRPQRYSRSRGYIAADNLIYGQPGGRLNVRPRGWPPWPRHAPFWAVLGLPLEWHFAVHGLRWTSCSDPRWSLSLRHRTYFGSWTNPISNQLV